jgi:molecular chaperone GrpE (heat shock protein)
MISHFDQRENKEGIGKQLNFLHDSLVDVLRESCGVEPYTFTLGTKLDLDIRKRIQITETSGGGNSSEQAEIVEVFRPGYVCLSGANGSATILRKAEVKTGRRAESTANAEPAVTA